MSFTPPPCDEFTTYDPLFNATLVNPPGHNCTFSPTRQNGRKSTRLPETSLSIKVGEDDKSNVG